MVEYPDCFQFPAEWADLSDHEKADAIAESWRMMLRHLVVIRKSKASNTWPKLNACIEIMKDGRCKTLKSIDGGLAAGVAGAVDSIGGGLAAGTC